ncbi:MAG: exosortase [Verrucomicrobiaceae bacterium]|nr:exosortase [Verrucomicrobiaceae bacterium]
MIRHLTIALLLAAAAILVAVLPYAAGYGPIKRSILSHLLMYWKDPTWQHGALALPIAIYLIWRRRAEITAIPAKPTHLGLPVIVIALFFYYAGYRANNFYLGFIGLMSLIAGASLWLVGTRRTLEGAFPWLMLGFAWPLAFLESSLAFEMRFLMIRLTSGILTFLDVPVIQEGTTLLSGPAHGREAGALFSLNVEGPCSGMRSLFALMMVGALFSYHRQKGLWQRCFLFLMTFPLAILANMARILVLLGASTIFGQSFAIGDADKEVSTFHFLTGIVVFLVALAGLQGIAWLMDRLAKTERASTVRRIAVSNA